MNKGKGAISDRIYRALLRLFPPAFRREYFDSLVGLFRDWRREARRGRLATSRLWLFVLGDLVSSALAERVQEVLCLLRPAHTDVGPTLAEFAQDEESRRLAAIARRNLELEQLYAGTQPAGFGRPMSGPERVWPWSAGWSPTDSVKFGIPLGSYSSQQIVLGALVMAFVVVLLVALALNFRWFGLP